MDGTDVLDVMDPSPGALSWDSFNFNDTSIAPVDDSFSVATVDLTGEGSDVAGMGVTTTTTDWQGGVSNPPAPVSDVVRGFGYNTGGTPISQNEAVAMTGADVARNITNATAVTVSAVGGLQALWGAFQSKPLPNPTATGGARNAAYTSTPTIAKTGTATGVQPVDAFGNGLFAGLKKYFKAGTSQVSSTATGATANIVNASAAAGPRPNPTNADAGAQSQIAMAVIGALVGVAAIAIFTRKA
jgi:hypothetical protein